MLVKVAACQYPIDRLTGWDGYAAKVETLVAEAAAAGAQLLLFPEYASLELASWQEEPVRADLQATLAALQPWLPPFLALHEGLARRYRVHLLAGSFPVQAGDGYRNRAHLFGPAGALGFQDKLIMTRFEREQWGIGPGSGLKVFATELGRLAINICYDAEFPLLARAQLAAGAEILLVPSCTDGWAGYHRVRIACQARALEGQCYVVQSPTLGLAPWSPAVDENHGLAGVFCPPDRGLPADGVLALGRPSQRGWIYAWLDLRLAAQVRRDGQVLNLRDWPAQEAALAVPVQLVP
jgi:predicted amidohydrolase